MPEIIFYRQMRRDGGTRTGIEIGGDTAFSRFDEGTSDRDPALVWYIDVRCAGLQLPQDRDGARDWLLRHSSAIGQLVTDAANRIPAGSDPVESPLQTNGAIDGASVTIACSAVRRVEARELSHILHDFAAHVRSHIESLQALPAA